MGRHSAAVIIRMRTASSVSTNGLAVDAGSDSRALLPKQYQSPSGSCRLTMARTRSAERAHSVHRWARHRIPAKGYFLASHLEVRIGVSRGCKSDGTTVPLAGRVQYKRLGHGDVVLLPGTYLAREDPGCRHGLLTAEDYRAYASDVFVDYPSGAAPITGQFDYNGFDGGAM